MLICTKSKLVLHLPRILKLVSLSDHEKVFTILSIYVIKHPLLGTKRLS